MTMTKRRLLLIAAVPLVACAMTLGVLAMLPPSPGVTKSNFDRVAKEMTRAEVERIFGGKKTFTEGPYDIWEADDESLALIGFEDNSVTHLFWEDSGETFLNKIRRWLHLR